MRLSRPPPILWRTVQLAVALGLMALLWRVADGAEAARRLAGADPVWLMAAVAALTAQTVLSALRWRLTAAQLGIALDHRTALREYYLSQIVNQALPGGVLGDAGRAVRARAQAGLMASGQAVVFERLAGQIAMFVVLAVAFAVTWALPGGVDWPGWLVTPVAVFVLAGVMMPGVVWALVRLVPGRAMRGLAALGAAFGHALLAPAVRGRQVGLSLATALCNIAAFVCCVRAVGADPGIAAMLALVPLILFTMVIPITISGWGLREGAAAVMLPLAGLQPAEALAASVAFGLMFLTSVLPGLVLVAATSTPRPLKS
jgi:uncharacterized membrane protein YbhN (UPF0104 family)